MDAQLWQADDLAWSALRAASRDADASLRSLAVCSVADGPTPAARIMILRGASETGRTLEFHTDTRSNKWAEMTTNPRVVVLGYDPDTRVQLRFDGHVSLFGPETTTAREVWSGLSVWTRTTYQGGPPGEPCDAPDDPSGSRAQHDRDGAGRDRFGVLEIRVSALDWVSLERGNNRRARFQYDASDGSPTGSWIVP